MTCDVCMGTSNEDVAKFEQNSEAVRQLLIKSDSGRPADFYKNQLFPVLTAKQIKERDEEKKVLFNEESFKAIRKAHRPDIVN